MATSTAEEQHRGPGLTRVITLTDAIVAIAMTLLVLPVVDAAGQVDTSHPGRWLDAHGYLLLSFVISFLVIYGFWSAHAGVLRHLETTEIDVPGLRALNMLWLLVIAFLPFPTSVVGHRPDTISAPFYIGTMLVLSVLTSGIVMVVERADRQVGRRGWAWAWAWARPVVFAGCTILSLFDADLGLRSLLLLVVLPILETRLRRRT